PPIRLASSDPPQKRWTREECAVLESAGVELHPYELIEGELIQKMGKNHRHMIALMRLCNWLRGVFGNLAVVQEPSIDVASLDNPASEPEPDVIVVARDFPELVPRAQPGDIRLLVEVSGSTPRFDLTTKADLYARATIAEYWVLDLNSRRMIVHRDPVQGKYSDITAYSEEEFLSPLAAPSAQVRVSDLL
ncbi:MAG: Uma2 family endonuclease, partial [Bryobacteraceae bacterium]